VIDLGDKNIDDVIGSLKRRLDEHIQKNNNHINGTFMDDIIMENASDKCIRYDQARFKTDSGFCYIEKLPLGFYCPYREACPDENGLTRCDYDNNKI